MGKLLGRFVTTAVKIYLKEEVLRIWAGSN
jgi:hypothetical protein